MSESMMLTDDF